MMDITLRFERISPGRYIVRRGDTAIATIVKFYSRQISQPWRLLWDWNAELVGWNQAADFFTCSDAKTYAREHLHER